MSLSGNVQTMPLPDVLQFIGLGRKTGVLRVVHGRATKEVLFEEGVAICCSSNSPKEYLGQHLLARTDLSEADLERAFRRQQSERRPLGEILVASGKITAQELDKVLRRKIEDAMYELFAWEAGDFTFEEGELDPARIPVRVSLGWESLVMEGARRVDELAVIRERFPTDSVRLRARRDRFPEGFPRSGGDRKLVGLVEKGLSIRKILPRFHLSDFDILARLADLCREGLLEVEQDTLRQEPAVDRDDLLAEGSALLAQERFAEALELLRTGLRLFPEDPSIGEALASVELRLRRAFPDLDTVVPELAVGLDELQALELDSTQGFVVSRVNGQWSVRSIAQICPFEEADVLAILQELQRRGLVRLGQPVAERS